jgi:hypothetical protein
MIISNAMSETREQTTVILVVSKLGSAQVFASGDHTERIYGFSGKPSWSKTAKIDNSPLRCLSHHQVYEIFIP